MAEAGKKEAEPAGQAIGSQSPEPSRPLLSTRMVITAYSSITAVKDEFPSIPPQKVKRAEHGYSTLHVAKKRDS